MAVDLMLVPAGSDPATAQPSRTMHLDDNGYYWFLHPLFQELAKQTGKSIDLYGDTKFAVHELSQLRALLTKAKSNVAAQPSKWRVRVGTRAAPVEREVYDEVEKQEFQRLLDRFTSLIDECENSGGEIHCVGD